MTVKKKNLIKLDFTIFIWKNFDDKNCAEVIHNHKFMEAYGILKQVSTEEQNP